MLYLKKFRICTMVQHDLPSKSLRNILKRSISQTIEAQGVIFIFGGPGPGASFFILKELRIGSTQTNLFCELSYQNC